SSPLYPQSLQEFLCVREDQERQYPAPLSSAQAGCHLQRRGEELERPPRPPRLGLGAHRRPPAPQPRAPGPRAVRSRRSLSPAAARSFSLPRARRHLSRQEVRVQGLPRGGDLPPQASGERPDASVFQDLRPRRPGEETSREVL